MGRYKTTRGINLAHYTVRKAELKDIQPIKKLQDENYLTNIRDDEKQSEGYLSLSTDLSILHKVNKDIGIAVAEDESIIVGYEIPFELDHLNQMPFWKPFIKSIKNLTYDGKKISEYKFVIGGQICIARDYKGRGIAQNLHKYFIEMLRKNYDLIISEVSYQNPRSLRVSTTKLGYHIIDSYKENEKRWHIILQDIRKI